MSRNTAILLIECPDQKGLVATVANFVYRYGGNILHSNQHDDALQRRFLMRVEWDLAGCDLDLEGFREAFAPIGKEYGMSWRIESSAAPAKLAIFVSRYDHCLADILYRQTQNELHCEVKLVIGNHDTAKPLADFYGVPFHHIPVTAETKKKAEAAQLDLLARNDIALVALARYMQVLSPEFLTAFGKPIINVHHSFLPAFSGAKPYQRAHERGVKLIGATSHYVNQELDEGPIIEQGVTRVSHRDELPDLIRKGRDLERVVLSHAIAWHAQHRILLYNGKTVIFD